MKRTPKRVAEIRLMGFLSEPEAHEDRGQTEVMPWRAIEDGYAVAPVLGVFDQGRIRQYVLVALAGDVATYDEICP